MSDPSAQSDLDTPPDRQGRFAPRTIAASALALGALSLPDQTRMSPGRRHLLRLARSTYVGWYTADMARHTPLPSVPAPLFGAVAGAAAALATAPVDEASDRWLADRLGSWGVRRPRLAMALIGAGMGALLALDQQRQQSSQDQELLDPEDLFETVEVPEAARALVTAMLEAVVAEDAAAPGLDGAAAILGEQLEQAKASVLRHELMYTDVFFSDLEDTTRVVPHAQTWPVRAHFEAGDVPMMVELTIGDGRLGGLSIMHRDQDLGEDDPRWEVELLDVLETWPAPHEVRLVVETAEGYRPLG